MSNKAYDLLVFDWDGTLMDSEAHIVDCLRVAMDAVKADVKPDEDLRQVIGLGLPEAIASLLPDHGEHVHKDAVNAFRAEFLSDKPVPSRLFEGAEELLQALKAEGYMLAVATGKSRSGLDKVLLETGLEPMFAATRTADETFSKPHPGMLEEILVDLDTEPHRALVIGDTEFDLQMANNARVASVGVSYGVHGIERLNKQQPLAIFDEILELGHWLSSRTQLK